MGANMMHIKVVTKCLHEDPPRNLYVAILQGMQYCRRLHIAKYAILQLASDDLIAKPQVSSF